MNDIKSEFDIIDTSIEQELKTSYIDYAMNVITSRAIPDIRDGLKPVQRRIIYAMKTVGNTFDKPFKKSARIVGEVVGKYHPHSNESVYDAMTRMIQSFSCNYPLIEGQGNFGSIDGDSPAAFRYTALRMSKFGQYMVTDLEKDTVSFSLNYDDTEIIPDVLPCQIPNLLINGASGIAVGMATNIPSHNLTEVIKALIALMNRPHLSLEELMEYIPGPSFPTGGIICGTQGVVDAYTSGKGSITLRAKTHIDHEKRQIIVTELPYQVNKSLLVEDLAQQVNFKKITGIADIRDESDMKGICIVIQIKKDAVAEVVLNNLFMQSKLQTYFHVNFVAIDNTGSPKTFKLQEALQAFIDFRISIVTKRTIFELKKSQSRLHILQGLAAAIGNINAIVTHIKLLDSTKAVREYLINTPLAINTIDDYFVHLSDTIISDKLNTIQNDLFYFSIDQVNAVLELKLTSLTNLEANKLKKDAIDLVEKINICNKILGSKEEVLAVIIKELETIQNSNGIPRLTEIQGEAININEEDLISPDEMVVSFSRSGYIKSQRLDNYNVKNRGAVGIHSSKLKEEDTITQVYTTSRKATLLCFSNKGRAFWLKVYHIPEMERFAKGRPINNLLPLEADETIEFLLPLDAKLNTHLFFTTKHGIVKRTDLSLFARPRTSGLKFITLKENDSLAYVNLTSGDEDIMIFSSGGKVCRFKETLVRSMGRQAAGVKGMKIAPEEYIVSVLHLPVDSDKDISILTVTEHGYGKRSKLSFYKTTNRGVKGIKSIASSERNGNVIGAAIVDETDNVLLITDSGVVTRMHVKNISLISRVTKGVKLMSMRNDSKLIALSVIKEKIDELIKDELVIIEHETPII